MRCSKAIAMYVINLRKSGEQDEASAKQREYRGTRKKPWFARTRHQHLTPMRRSLAQLLR